MYAYHASIFIRCAQIRVNGRVLSLSACAVFKFSVDSKRRDKSEFGERKRAEFRALQGDGR